jgi:hypothetical protein
MEIDTESKSTDTWKDKLYNKIIYISDFIGSIIYKDRIITKEEILQKILPKRLKKQKNSRGLSNTVNIYELIKSLFSKKKSATKSDKKRTTGLIIFGGIILLCVIFIVYILNIIINIILDIMEWWVLGIILLAFLLPISFAIAYILASDDY